MKIKVPDGRGKYYDELLDKYGGIGYGYKLDNVEKEKKFLYDIETIIKEDIEFKDKLVLLDFLIYQVQIDDSVD